MRAMDVGLRFKVEHARSDEYPKTCRVEDEAAERVIREFVREWVVKRAAETHPSLPAEPLERSR